MTRPGSETPAPPPPGDDATAPAAISPSDPRLQRCAFAVLRGKNVHELEDGRNVNEFFVRTFDVSLGRRSRNGGADVVISGTGGERGGKREGRRTREAEKKRRAEEKKKETSNLFLPHPSLPLSPRQKPRAQATT